jgi:PKHD-type hydroxylase
MRGYTPAHIAEEAILSPSMCETLVRKFSDITSTTKIGKNVKNQNVRSTQGHSIPDSKAGDLYRIVTDELDRVNSMHWEFELDELDPIQFLQYNQGGHYTWHTDLGPGRHAKRKLSIVIPLSDPAEYEGGELLIKIGEKETSVPLKQGHAILFPSYILHKVTPVTKGKRFMLVGWMKGKTAFR